MELTEEQKQQVATSIEVQIDKLRKSWHGKLQKIKKPRSPLLYSKDQFLKLIAAYANVIMCQRRERNEFIINENNSEFLDLLFKYSIYDKTLNTETFDIDKGIMLTGAFGCGKSVIMEAFCELINNKTKFDDPTYKYPIEKQIKFIKSQDLFDELKWDYSQNEYKKNIRYGFDIVCVDEFGREPKVTKNYGDESHPILNWLSFRYDHGVLTHGTSNFKFETLSSNEFYGEMIGDRLKTMFNFVILNGKSWRK